jgi:hypothetical protein
MSEINKKSISFLLLLLFLVPLVVKIEHRHEAHNHTCTIDFSGEKKELSYQESHEECPICQYEFLFLLTAIKDTESQRKTLDFELLNNYISILISGTEINYISLRAPPILTL